MPAWTDKDARQYDAIKAAVQDQGRSEEKANEIAARTVNKHRREQGRTPNVTTQGTGNPNLPLEERSRRELYNRARQLKISGRSRMNKQDLVNAIRSQG